MLAIQHSRCSARKTSRNTRFLRTGCEEKPTFRDFNYDSPHALGDVARCFRYRIALTDCDGFRLDTLKLVSQE